MRDGLYVKNLDEYKSTGTHWRALYMNGEIVTYFDSLGVEHIPKEITNIYKIQTNDAIM